MRLFVFLLFVQSLLFSQTPETIKVKKEAALYFFQTGQKSDTISLNKNDLFYLKITCELRCQLRIEIVNAKLLRTQNDSIFQLKKMPNLQYEHYYKDSTFVANKPKSKATNENCYKLITHINGANEGDGNTITIQIYNIYSRETLLSNKFYYK